MRDSAIKWEIAYCKGKLFMELRLKNKVFFCRTKEGERYAYLLFSLKNERKEKVEL